MKPIKLLASTSLAVAILFIAAPVHAAPNGNTQNLIKNAVIGNMFEIETSQTALQKSQNSDVRAFAQSMIDDHKKAEQTVEDTLRQEGLANLEPPAVDRSHQKTEDKLSKDSADKFDKDYINAQVDAHKDAVKLFQKYSSNGDDPGLKTVAGQLLPTLQHHQQMANDLKKNYKSGKTTAAINAGSTNNSVTPAAGGDAVGTSTSGNPNLDRPATNADSNMDTPSTANPTEGRSSPSGGPTN